MLTVFVLSFGVPGAGNALSEVVSTLAGIECCDDDCDAQGEQGCSMTCTDCACCTHAGPVAAVVPAAVAFMLGRPALSELTFGWHDDGPYTSGYRAPPFRSPLA